MEYALRELLRRNMKNPRNVLILILMEYALREAEIAQVTEEQKRS